MVKVPESLLKFFHRRDMFFWDSLVAGWQDSIPLWKDVEILEMPHSLALHWEHIRSSLRSCGFFRQVESDFFIWKLSKEMNMVRVKDVYQDLIGSKLLTRNSVFPCIFWKDGCPSKMIYFAWLTFHNKNLTWENLMKRGWHGPSLCFICRSEGENNEHLFFECKKTKQLWQALEICYGVQHKTHASIAEAFLWCNDQKKSWRRIFIISLWIIWKWWNNAIFNGIKSPFMENFFNIVSSFQGLPQKPLKLKKDVYLDLSMELSAFPRAFFDGAEQNGSCGCGFLIMVNENFHFSIHWNGGKGSNSKAEVMAVVGLLKFCLFLDIQDVTVFGDSKVMVDFVSRKNHILISHLAGWLDRIQFFWECLAGGSIHRISRDKNSQADSLSKMGLQSAPSSWFLQVFAEGENYLIQDFSLPDF